jgi:hypothetical protein
MFNINFLLGVVIQVFLIFVFLTVFFFTYASKKEGEIVKNQVDFLTKDFLATELSLLPDSVKAMIAEKINTIEPDTSRNKTIEDSNNEIKAKTTKILVSLGVIIFVFTVASFFLSKKVEFFKNLNLIHILKETAVILFFVALTEFIFLEYFAARFISVEPNLIKSRIYKNLATI